MDTASAIGTNSPHDARHTTLHDSKGTVSEADRAGMEPLNGRRLRAARSGGAPGPRARSRFRVPPLSETQAG